MAFLILRRFQQKISTKDLKQTQEDKFLLGAVIWPEVSGVRRVRSMR